MTKKDASKTVGGPTNNASDASASNSQSSPSKVASHIPSPTPEQIKAAEQKFEQGIINRGEAVDADKALPPGATHVIVGYNADGSPILKRKRYSLH